MANDALIAVGHEELEAMLATADPALQAEIAEEMKLREDQRIDQLRDLVKRKEEHRDKDVRAKKSIERRWAEDKMQKHGIIGESRADRIGYPGGKGETTPPGLNLTKNRCELWTARVSNMVVPGNQIPVQMLPTPSPKIADPQTGELLPPDEAKAAADKIAGRMNQEIKDQFAECHLAAQLRLACSDFIDYGTGVITGPENFRRKRKQFKRLEGGGYSGYEMVQDDKVAPTWRRVDLRYFFPEMTDTITSAQYVNEVIPMTRTQLQKLSEEPGFDKFKAQFQELLTRDEAPNLGAWGDCVTQWNKLSPTKEAIEGRFAVWRHVGAFEKKDMEACGIECCEEDELIVQPMIELWFCEGLPLKAEPYVLDGDRLPYYVNAFDKLDDTMFGGSLPFRARDAQDSITALWMAIQHNTAVSSGPINFWYDGKVEPYDNDPRILGPKNMRVIDPDVRSVKDIVNSLIFPNVTGEMLQVLEFRIAMFDQEINLPAIAQGQPSEVVQTASGILMETNAANVPQKDMAQRCEDEWITPIAESAYHWNMLHNERDDIKGDFDCVASLTSDNLFREVKANRLMLLRKMAMEDPELKIRIKEERFHEILAQCMEIEADIFRTDEEVKQLQAEQHQNQQQDPMVALKEQELALKDKKIGADNLVAAQKMEIAAQDSQTKREIAMMNREQAFAALALQENLTFADIQAGMERARGEQSIKQQEMGAKARIEAEKMAAKERADAVEIAAERNRAPGPILA